MNIKELISAQKVIDELLIDLDRIAKEHDGYEYGLPIHNDGQKALLREAVLKWFLQIERA